jgi:glycerophosphoryl diester phosphodiesterase
VDATTNGSGRVSEMTLAELEKLDAGSPHDPAFAGERIPTLDDVLEAIGNRLLLNVELKSTSLCDQGLERATIARIKRRKLDDVVILSSFNPLSLRRAKRIAPHIALGLLYAPNMPLPLRRAWFAFLAPCQAHHPEHSLVDGDYVAWARRHGYQINTWTVDNPDEMQRLINLGVDSIITNAPDVLHNVLTSQKQH